MSSRCRSSEICDGIAGQDDYRVVEAASATGCYLKINNQRAPAVDIHVRRAITLTTDCETIRDVIYPGGVMEGPLAGAFAHAVPSEAEAPVPSLRDRRPPGQRNARRGARRDARGLGALSILRAVCPIRRAKAGGRPPRSRSGLCRD